MSTDIFPEINIPVASAIFTYTGISADEMEKRISTIAERAFTTTVTTSSTSSLSRSTAFPSSGLLPSECARRGRRGPDHRDVPIRASGNASEHVFAVHCSVQRIQHPDPAACRERKDDVEQQLYDYSTNFIRTQLATVRGASVLLPVGGRPRQIMVDLDPKALFAKGLSPNDVTNSLGARI